jgi:hypothetical protein
MEEGIMKKLNSVYPKKGGMGIFKGGMNIMKCECLNKNY